MSENDRFCKLRHFFLLSLAHLANSNSLLGKVDIADEFPPAGEHLFLEIMQSLKHSYQVAFIPASKSQSEELCTALVDTCKTLSVLKERSSILSKVNVGSS